MSIKNFPRHLAKYLFDNINKGLIGFRNLESELHFYENYDTSSYFDLLENADNTKFIMNLYSVADWDYKQTWDDLLDKNGKVKLSIFTLNSLFEDEKEYFNNKLGDKEYILEYNDKDGILDIIVDKKQLSPEYVGYLLDKNKDRLPWGDVEFIPELPPNIKDEWIEGWQKVADTMDERLENSISHEEIFDKYFDLDKKLSEEGMEEFAEGLSKLDERDGQLLDHSDELKEG